MYEWRKRFRNVAFWVFSPASGPIRMTNSASAGGGSLTLDELQGTMVFKQRRALLIRFLREEEVAKAFRGSRRSGAAFVAAPGWGYGAVDALDLQQGDRIICNLSNPAGSLAVLAQAVQRGCELRSNPDLAARIFASETEVIIGSSDPRDEALTGAEEPVKSASLQTDDLAAVAEAKAFLESLWNSEKTVVVTEDIINAEAPQPSKAQRGIKSRTLLAACREKPDWFKDVFVVAYNQPLSRGLDKALRAIQDQPFDEESNNGDLAEFWGYDLHKRLRGPSWLVTIDCVGKDPTVAGVARTQPADKWAALKKGVNLTVGTVEDVTEPITKRRLKLSALEKKALVGISDQLLTMSQPVSIAKVISLLPA